MGRNTFDTLGTTLRNEVDRIQFTAAAGMPNFTISYLGVQQTAAPLTAASPATGANSVLDALNTIPALNGNVSVQAVPGTPGSWWVSFTGGLAGQNLPGLTVTAPAFKTRLVQGRNAGVGPGPGADRLVGDFDNGSAAPQNDAMGLLYGISQTGVTPINEIQTITITGVPTGGTYRLGFQGFTSELSLDRNAPANGLNSVQEALETMGPLTGNVAVSGADGGPYTVQFIGGLAGADVEQLIVENNDLTGGTNPKVTVSTTMPGTDEVMMAPGDSGGPAFIGNQIAGVNHGKRTSKSIT
jgi:hypothetical protein